MYTKHFGLKMLPFENVPDPVFFFDEGDHARIHNRIKDSFRAGRGLMVVTGPIGSGKTTLSQMLISEFFNNIKLIWLAEPPENSLDLFLFIAQELSLKPTTSERVFILRDLKNVLLMIKSEGSKCLVIIDEAHLITDDTLHGIRLLNNLEEGSAKLIQILLLGQEELITIINRPEAEAFKQRIGTMEIMGKMNADRIRAYVLHRLQVAGGASSIFADTGWQALFLAFGSGCTPRVINSLCDRSLNVAFERGKSLVDVDDVYEAAQGMGLGKDIFFYKIALKQKERDKQVPSTGENDSIKEPEALSQRPSFSKESYGTNMGYKNRQSEISQSANKGSEIGFSISKIVQKGLKMPILFFLLSIIALILSFFFYCQKSFSPDLMTCIHDLIGF